MKISIIPGAFCVTSKIKKEDFDLVKKHNPDALKVFNEDGDEIFTVNYNESCPAIESFGITFGGVSTAEDTKGYLTFTGVIPSSVADAKEYVADKVGVLWDNYKLIEDNFAENVKAVKDARKTIKDSITVVG